MAENERNSYENESSKQSQKHRGNPSTGQEKVETVGNSKNRRTSNVMEPQEKQERKAGNEGNSKADGSSHATQAQEMLMDTHTKQEQDHNVGNSKGRRNSSVVEPQEKQKETTENAKDEGNSKADGSSRATHAQEMLMDPRTKQEQDHNERNSRENQTCGVEKRKQRQRKNPTTKQEKDETVGNSKDGRNRSVIKPQPQQEKMTGNEGNSKAHGKQQAQQEKDHNVTKSKDKSENVGKNIKLKFRSLISKVTSSEKTANGLVPAGAHYGLYNQGSTCYLNSILQVLYMTREIHDRLDTESQNTDRELKTLFETMKKEKGQTEHLTQCLHIENVHEQRDAAECLEIILNKISPQASEVFKGELMYTTTCKRNNHIINEETNPFWTLPLSLTDDHNPAYSVKDNFSSFFKTKEFGGEDLVYCETCDEDGLASSVCRMVHHPQVLTLLLKRFTFDDRTKTYSKSNRAVDVPLLLSTENKQYALYGMVDHWGQLGGGHYTATLCSENGKAWFVFNDAHVQQAWKQPSAEPTYSSSSAYLLMYRGKDVNKAKRPHIFKGFPNKKLSKKKTEKAPLENEKFSAEQLQEDQKEEREEKEGKEEREEGEEKKEKEEKEEKEKQGDNNISFRGNESKILPDEPFTTSEPQTGDKAQREDVMEAEMKTAREREDGQSKTEYREEPQMTAVGDDDASVCSGSPKNMETIACESYQRKGQSDTQDNRKPPITKEGSRSATANTSSASSSPEVMLQNLNQRQQSLNKHKSSKTPQKTDLMQTQC